VSRFQRELPLKRKPPIPKAALRVPGRKPVDERPVHVRFVCFQEVKGQRNRLGLFQALDEARKRDHAASWALAEIKAANDGCNNELDAPTTFSRGSWRKPGQLALCWFKSAATEHIQRKHRLKRALEDCGIHVEGLTTPNPGHILFEDDQQVAAEPLHNRF
jgi:hypothetical protein